MIQDPSQLLCWNSTSATQKLLTKSHLIVDLIQNSIQKKDECTYKVVTSGLHGAQGLHKDSTLYIPVHPGVLMSNLSW